jgi:hypothetical protein
MQQRVVAEAIHDEHYASTRNRHLRAHARHTSVYATALRVHPQRRALRVHPQQPPASTREACVSIREAYVSMRYRCLRGLELLVPARAFGGALACTPLLMPLRPSLTEARRTLHRQHTSAYAPEHTSAYATDASEAFADKSASYLSEGSIKLY